MLSFNRFVKEETGKEGVEVWGTMKLKGGLRDPTETMGIETNVSKKCDKLSLSFQQ